MTYKLLSAELIKQHVIDNKIVKQICKVEIYSDLVYIKNKGLYTNSGAFIGLVIQNDKDKIVMRIP